MSDKKTMSLRDVRKMETRQQIQDAARELIAEHGFEKTTMRMVAAEAGVGLGTVSLHFKDKESLLLASFYDEIGALSVNAIKEAPMEGTVREQFLAVVGKLFDYYATNTRYLSSVVRVALFTRGEWRQRFDAQVEGTVAIAAQLFEAGKQRGEVRQEVNSFQVGYACWCLYLTILIDGLNADVFDADTQMAKLEGLVDVLLEGVLV